MTVYAIYIVYNPVEKKLSLPLHSTPQYADMAIRDMKAEDEKYGDSNKWTYSVERLTVL